MFFETARLQKLRCDGIQMPPVLYVCDDYFVMRCTGESLEAVLDRSADDRHTVIAKALSVLCQMHNNGSIHGGSQIRNFTMLDGEVYAILKK